MKLAIVTSHPIQYQTPLFRLLAEQAEVDLTVYFCWDFGMKSTLDPQLNVFVQWDIPMLGGYRSHFLNNLSPWPSSDFWGQINPSVIWELTQGKYDAVLVYGWNSFTNWLAMTVSFLLGIPILMHGESPKSNEPAGVKLFVKRMILSTLFQKIKSFLVIGNQNKLFYLQYGVPEKKMTSVPYAIENSRFMSAASVAQDKKDDLRYTYGISKDSLIVLFVGKLIKKKRPFDLLSAFEKVLHNKPELTASLVYVGDGELRVALEQAAQRSTINSRVFFRGFCNQTELPMWYAIADIFVLPSGEGETWGLVVNEAMCASLPIIVSDAAGCADDLVVPGINGYRYECGNIDQLVDSIVKLVTNRKQREEYGRESCKRIQVYSHEVDILGIVSALSSLKIHVA